MGWSGFISGARLGFARARRGDLGGKSWEASLCENANDSLGDPVREFVGPLRDCLIGDANRFGSSSNRASEQFYGF